MPAKTKERAREIARTWYYRNKERAYEYYKITRIARRKHPTPQPCCVDGCKKLGERHHPDYSKPAEIVWMCRKHHALSHRTYCTVCGERAVAKKLCPVHYRESRTAEAEAYNAKRRAYRREHPEETRRKRKETYLKYGK